MIPVIRRELRLALRHPSDTLGAVLFFVIVCAMFPFGVGPAPELLARIAPGALLMFRDGEPAALGALNASLGATINEWAGGAPRQLAATIDQALRWDEENENSITSKELHQTVLINQRDGLRALRDQVLSDREALLVERRRRGLEVRE